VAAAVVWLILRNLSVFGNILLAIVGFGTVVIVHEFGHFVVAKLSRIKVEAFSIFMPPVVLGLRKTNEGYRFRILPRFFPKENDESGEGRLSFTVGRGGEPWETEYRIGLIPFGGYVKMLGQEDVGPVEDASDPRSYANRPVGVRMAVIAAGVIFNIISAFIAFMIVFIVGINRPAPVVGYVHPDSPAARAGLRPGDEVIEIEGKSKNLDFSDIQMAAALSGRREPVNLRVRHEDGSEEDFAIVPEYVPGARRKAFGVGGGSILTVAKIPHPDKLYEKTGLQPGDRITAVNGADVQTHWQLQEIVGKAFVPAVALSAERTTPALKTTKRVETQIPLSWLFAGSVDVESESELYHIYSMVPRLRITVVSEKPTSLGDKIRSLLGKKTAGEDQATGAEPRLEVGDIILSVGDVQNPTYKELRDITERCEGKELPIKVLRADTEGAEKVVTVTVKPERPPGDERAKKGVGVALDAEHPVVAKTITTEDGPPTLPIPRGALITAVDGVPVSSFYDIVGEIRKKPGQWVTIDYRLDAAAAGSVALSAGADAECITVRSYFAEFVPFEDLERLYKARGPIDAIVMGCRKTIVFITWAYLSLKRFLSGLVSPKEFMGPVGVVTLGYIVLTEKPLIYYLYILGLISAFIGVLNSVPVLPFDGGHIVFLLIEKIKGSPVSERVQVALAYAGWLLVGAFALYVTFNDIIRSFRWLSG
jgi:regulator of sigma E protease